MNRTVAAVVFLVSLSLLGLQLSGLHMHVDDHGYSGAAHGAHVHDAAGAHTHGAAVDPHDHSHDTDVAVFELGAIAAKHLVFLIAASVVLFALVRIALRLVPAVAPRVASRRRQHWRPPLRAPPAVPLFA
jgi:hypothetical protein